VLPMSISTARFHPTCCVDRVMTLVIQKFFSSKEMLTNP